MISPASYAIFARSAISWPGPFTAGGVMFKRSLSEPNHGQKPESIPGGKAEVAMNDLEFAALLVSRLCHDLVSPVGAVVNGLEVLEEERDAALRADALSLVTSGADLAAARLQFARIAF